MTADTLTAAAQLTIQQCQDLAGSGWPATIENIAGLAVMGFLGWALFRYVIGSR